MTRLLLPLLASLLALVGCGAPPSTVSLKQTPSAPTEATTGQDVPPRLTLRIPSLSIDAPLTELHLDADGVLETPPVTTPEVAGWYADGVVPGDPGPALVAGHVSGRPEGADHSVPGVFARLATLAERDHVTIDRDHTPLVFEVYRVETVRKDAFPTEQVYGDTEGPELRLVTCGGVFDPAAHSYESNVIVFARLVAN